MGIPKYAERVTALETEWKVFRTETFPAFQSDLKGDLSELGEKIDAASLNGETPRVKNISKRLGAPEDVEILTTLVEAHKRRAWLLSPLLYANDKVVNAALWVITGAALAVFHAWLHAAFPIFP